MLYWCRGCVALGFIALVACGRAGASPPPDSVLPTAYVAVRAAGPAQIIPLPPTPTIALPEGVTPTPSGSAVLSKLPASPTSAPAAEPHPAAPTPADADWAMLEAQLV